MQQKFTHLNLIRFLYKETSAEESLAIAEAIAADENLASEYHALATAYKLLPKTKFKPSLSAVNRILAYSKQGRLEAQA